MMALCVTQYRRRVCWCDGHEDRVTNTELMVVVLTFKGSLVYTPAFPTFVLLSEIILNVVNISNVYSIS